MTSPEPSSLIPAQRRELIIESLREHSVLSYRQLADLLGVSQMTIRRDIAVLESEKRAAPTTGGARIGGPIPAEPSRIEKDCVDRGEKAAITTKASSLVEDSMTIYLDAGTTLQPMHEHLAQVKDLTVVTNDIVIASSFVNHPTIDVIVVGGRIDKRNLSLVGRLPALLLGELSIDIAFLTASSWDLGHGITTPSEEKVSPKRAAVRAASQVVLAAASSKYGTFSRYRVLDLDRLNAIITDEHLSPETAQAIEDSSDVTVFRCPLGDHEGDQGSP